MPNDVIAKCIASNLIDNGGILVNAPKATDQLSGIYQINTYSSTGIGTGLIYDQYDLRFTGVAPCLSCSGTTSVAGPGMGMVFWA